MYDRCAVGDGKKTIINASVTQNRANTSFRSALIDVSVSERLKLLVFFSNGDFTTNGLHVMSSDFRICRSGSCLWMLLEMSSVLYFAVYFSAAMQLTDFSFFFPSLERTLPPLCVASWIYFFSSSHPCHRHRSDAPIMPFHSAGGLIQRWDERGIIMHRSRSNPMIRQMPGGPITARYKPPWGH